ncbi:hypothetical protein [Rhizobium leguminosarum]|uniref:hypothetical protein n=1 Tax=Rhizobium leguminosarum TaxID=384 RepID=UPI001441D8F2|nr:hypothetical protein [Rhizobium leguminosarum]NKL04078.1 hypothetical protein [Rhizobium leguminosarum bv. viciae]NKL83918.1 hypothetical protein [Rhizobium leguminosarum bv. viciae]NKL89242.1 hypothetical protein [Rhizobium leguminosarum bv. viciae]
MPQIPMMGVHFADQFLVAFVVGVLFVAYFAWDRFHTRQSTGLDFRYRVMKEIDVADLGGAPALRQAYLIYVVTLLFIYVAMTFFGKLIVQTLNELKVVGVQVDASSLQFDSPQWPLLLAFGFAGLAPLIPQLRIAEEWLFQRAYRAVGIPVRINETTRNLLSILDAASTGQPNDAPNLVNELAKRTSRLRSTVDGSWAVNCVTPWKIEDGVLQLAQLELLMAWAKGRRGAWPGSEVSESVRNLEQTIASQADELLDGFERRLGEPADAKVTRSQKYLVETFERAHALRDELTAILAVYVERDPDPGNSSDEPAKLYRAPGLHELLKKADPPNLAGTGPETGMLVAVFLTTPIYALFTWQGIQAPLTPRATPDSLNVIFATAGISVLILISIFWLPLLVAFAARQHYYDERKWVVRARHNHPTYVKQHLAILVLAVVVSVFCLSGVAALWTFLIARDVSTFQALLVGGTNPYLLSIASMALFVIPVVWFTMRSADARLSNHSATGLGFLSAICVFISQAVHLAFWTGGQSCISDAAFLTDLFASGCFVQYSGLDLFIMPVLAFLAAVVFGNPHPAARPAQHQQSTRAVDVAKVFSPALVVLIFGLQVPDAVAQEAPTKQDVMVGFRDGVEPFSFKVSADGGRQAGPQPIYKGFLADLCYWIFDGGDYSVKEVPVTALNRFEEMKGGKIDVLCDPVTMRFSQSVDPVTLRPTQRDRVDAGVFSPIVFATGISYLQRRNRTLGSSVLIGYVEGTTAENVLGDLCKVDLFGGVPSDERSELAAMCAAAATLRRVSLINLCDEDLISFIFGEKGDVLASKCTEPSVDGQHLEFLVMKTEWYRSVLDEAEKVVANEVTSIDKRLPTASGSQKSQLTEALRFWNQTITQLKSCDLVNQSCTPRWILNRLGDVCSGSDQASASGTTDGPPTGMWKRASYRFCPKKSHDELIRWFCDSGIKNAGMVYLGDREIILGKLQTWNDEHVAKCAVDDENGAGDLTYEPYAIMVRKPRSQDEMERLNNISETVKRRIYEFFSFSSLARAKFDTYFLGLRKDRTMSTALAYLFLLNGIEDERRFIFPTQDEKTVQQR